MPNVNVNPKMLIRSLAVLSFAFVLNVSIAAGQQPTPPAVTQAVLAGKLIDVRSGEVRFPNTTGAGVSRRACRWMTCASEATYVSS